MIKIDVLDEQYDVITEWSELTIEKFVKVQQIVDNAPKKLKDIIGYIYTNDKKELESIELSKNESLKTFPKFYGDMLGVLCDIDRKIINQIDRDSREQFFNVYLIKFAIGCLYAPIDIEPSGLDSFDFEGDTYYFPRAKKVLDKERPMGYLSTIQFTEAADLDVYMNGLDNKPSGLDSFDFEGDTYYFPRAKKVLDKERPMGYLSTIQFTEAADLDVYMNGLDNKDYSVLANICAILCVKDNEEYDEDVMLERAERFKQLPMNIAWDVFFYLGELLTTYTKTIVPYSLEKVKLNMQRQPNQAD